MKNILFILISILSLACNKESGGNVAVNNQDDAEVERVGVTYSVAINGLTPHIGSKISYSCLNGECAVSGEFYVWIDSGNKRHPVITTFNESTIYETVDGSFVGEITQDEPPLFRKYNLELTSDMRLISINDGVKCIKYTTPSTEEDYEAEMDLWIGSGWLWHDYIDFSAQGSGPLSTCE